MNPKVIVIDGKTYKSVSEMPEDVRRHYEEAMRSLKDQNGNSVPDVFEQNNLLVDQNKNGVPDIVENTPGERIFTSAMKILIDGREFNSINDLPPEARAKYEQAMGALDANRNGMPDFLEGMIRAQPDSTPVAASFATQSPPAIPRTPMPMDAPTITPDTSNGWMLGLLAALILFLCLAGAVGGWYFFLR
ncbi:MAG TPA: hypothetical protein VK909_12685 [Anaerolineales bacterium]|nr:hypothetical protein [Anaerolineales bacterium]